MQSEDFRPLRECPFCGGTPILELFNDGFFDYARIRCCRVMFDWCGDETGEQAIAAWNRRSDAVPVVRGEWIAEQKGAEYCEFRCSACDGSVGQTDQFDETEVKQFSEWYKYCPACGAKMEDKS